MKQIKIEDETHAMMARVAEMLGVSPTELADKAVREGMFGHLRTELTQPEPQPAPDPEPLPAEPKEPEIDPRVELAKEIKEAIQALEQHKSKVTGQQYVDMMVKLKGLEADLKKGPTSLCRHEPGTIINDKNGNTIAVYDSKGHPLEDGDKVRITDEVHIGDDYANCWSSDMDQYKGKTTRIDDLNDGEICLEIEDDNTYAGIWLTKVT